MIAALRDEYYAVDMSWRAKDSLAHRKRLGKVINILFGDWMGTPGGGYAPGGISTHPSTLPRCLIPAPVPMTFYGTSMRLSPDLNLSSIEIFETLKYISATCKVSQSHN
jgi:hypothetical protein